MKVITKGKEVEKPSSGYNHAERRRYNQKHKTNYTKLDFDVQVALARMQSGLGVEESMLKELAENGMVHLDNEELVPTGTPVKINADEILKQKRDDRTEAFFKWVEENRDKVFHLAREDNKQSLVCLEEDVRYVELDGKDKIADKWLFDLYTDILVEYEGEWIPVFAYDQKRPLKKTIADDGEEQHDQSYI